MIMANFSGLVGFGPYFPWSIPGLFGVSSVSGGGDHLLPVSYFILFLTSLSGLGVHCYGGISPIINREHFNLFCVKVSGRG